MCFQFFAGKLIISVSKTVKSVQNIIIWRIGQSFNQLIDSVCLWGIYLIFQLINLFSVFIYHFLTFVFQSCMVVRVAVINGFFQESQYRLRMFPKNSGNFSVNCSVRHRQPFDIVFNIFFFISSRQLWKLWKEQQRFIDNKARIGMVRQTGYYRIDA